MTKSYPTARALQQAGVIKRAKARRERMTALLSNAISYSALLRQYCHTHFGARVSDEITYEDSAARGVHCASFTMTTADGTTYEVTVSPKL